MIHVEMQRQEAEEVVELLLKVERGYFLDNALESLVFGLGMVSTPEQYEAWKREQIARLEGEG